MIHVRPSQTVPETDPPPPERFCSGCSIEGLRRVNHVLTDIVSELFPDRFHGIYPSLTLVRRYRAHLTTDIDNGLSVGLIDRERLRISKLGDLVQDRQELVADILI